MIINIIAFIIMSVPVLIEVLVDLREIKKKGTDKRKGNDMIWRAVLCLWCGFVQSWITDYSWWQGAILSGGIFLLTFDYIMALCLGKKFHYLGTTSHIDRFLRDFHWPYVLFVRGLIFVATATVYYDLYKVLYGRW
jgi:hypothetical protein